MVDFAIQTSHLSKQYKIYSSNRGRLLEALDPFRRSFHQTFWALQDVSFEVQRGETFGIIGRNGSGKSTLLQLITGVLTPTNGQVKRNGVISALLELGAGFNPEFSGRQNVMIQGAILGFSKQEMLKRLPEIEDFSELGRFLDLPVKTYSSGMYVRLAFSAAIHVDPDILIVDEALAVGDAKFQNKCFRKFEQFRKAGKTVILVTHDTHAIVRYCDRALLLDGGASVTIGSAKSTVNHYLELLHSKSLSQQYPPGNTPKQSAENEQNFAHIGYSSSPSKNQILSLFLSSVVTLDQCASRLSYNPHEHRYGNHKAQIVDYLLLCGEVVDPAQIKSSDEIDLYVKVYFFEDVGEPIYGVTLKNIHGVEIYGTNSWFAETPVQPRKAGTTALFHYHVRMSLTQGEYFLSVGVAEKTEDGFDADAIDRRYELIHLTLEQKGRSFGLVDLEGQIHELQSEGS